ncbi:MULTISPECIES: helix-turn-helix domain-containing protein [Paenibacillus]|uniref:Transcriptional antiterminator BglG n=1 Tax=Paenibacillus odorifer TaxID=189426 RepID=A0A1R0X3S2_9BACL|nr:MULTISPECIES: helix-turn-helix domain-containing protein [Paenibacillus]ETT67528.1 transcriptional antiterminator BglG [Paenibacillus sp. FSL H8-237]OMD03660.1 transcriptional antiterminator BglG [Paenibacillus odorifer]OMD16058.1 transcriptional antiterminator BglG [Paenibacillus odorifer]OMD27983.1 transcriptional antiterminator BglG [Paenibacillus odorifer]OMD28475.1 transcriptional antiterminator BglG [Paenibacillus odorifer]
MDKGFNLASQLLTLLDTEHRWFTLAEIEKSLGISDKTIRKMVEEISKQLPSTVTIEVSRGKGIVLQRDGRSTISEVISSMFRQTIFYRLMDFLFTNVGRLSVEELSEAMFMSTSSLKKLIVQLNNDDLKAYKLRISFSTPMIKGNEMNIRYFYWKLYCDAYEFTGWPFANVDFAYINQLITNIENENNIVYFINSKRRLSFLLAIVIERVAKGKCVKIDENAYPWEKGMFYFPVKTIAKRLEDKLSLKFPNSEIFFMQSMVSLSQYHYYEGSEITPMKEVELHKDKEEYQMGNLLLMLLAKVYPNLHMQERFILEIYGFFDKLLIENAIPEWMMISTSHLTTYVQKECQQIYQELQTCMQTWNKTYPSVLFNHFHLTKLTLIVRSSLRYKSKRAFLVIGEEFSIRHYIADLIKKEIGDQLILNTSIMKGLTDEIMQQNNIDLVISNIPVALKTVPVVIISTIPSKRDLDNIRKELLL